MMRRVNVLSSSRLFWAVLCLTLCGMPAGAASPDLPGTSSAAVADFIVAPSVSLSSTATSVAAGDLNADGKPDMAITKKSTGRVTVLLGDGNGGFAAGVDYAAGTQPGNVLVADINGDGKLDVLVTDNAGGAVDVLPGNGDGTLGTAVAYAVIPNPIGLALGNFSGNGNRDLAAASPSGLTVLLNDGSGHFSLASSLSLASQPLSLTAADVNADGNDDLILANQDGTISVLLGDGHGHFTALPASTVASAPLSSVVAGDFNKDGKVDLAVTQANSAVVTVLLGLGNGSFLTGVNYIVGNNPAAVIAADVNGDAVLDLITVNQSANTFSVLPGRGDGTFGSSLDFIAGNAPFAVAAADFNADGHLDLAIANSQDATISVPLGKGDGTFKAARSYTAGLQYKAIAAGDLNGDGRQDLVVTNYCGADSTCASNGNVAVFLANMDGSFQLSATYPLGGGPVAVALADLNGDKKFDMVALNRKDKTLMVMLGNGDGTFGQAQTYSLSASPRALFAGDFNGDGSIDVALVSDCGSTTCTQVGSLDIWLGNGNGTLTESTTYPVGYAPVSIAAGDLREIGHLDLVVANACGDDSSCVAQGTAMLFAGDGTGKFNQSGEIGIGSAPSVIAIGNFTGGRLDLVVAQSTSSQIAVLPGDGVGSFNTAVNYAAGETPAALAIADFNGDGQQDVAVANFQSSTVSVLYGTGTGTLQTAVAYPVGTGPESMAVVNASASTKSTSTGTSLVTANGSSSAPPSIASSSVTANAAVSRVRSAASSLATTAATSTSTLLGSDISLLVHASPMGVTAPASFTLVSSPASSTVNQQVSLTASVSGIPTPTGTVVFAYVLGGVTTPLNDCGGGSGLTLDGTGAATCVTQLLPAGAPAPVASYSGDGMYSSATTAATPPTVTMSAAYTTTTIQSSYGWGANSTVNDSVTFTASVAPSPNPGADIMPISGTVNFQNSGTTIANCSAQPVSFNSGSTYYTATCTTSALVAGMYSSIHAVYAGDSNYITSTSSDLQQTVVALAATIGVTASPSSSTKIDMPVTFTAQLAAAHLTPVVPSGTVKFTANTVPIAGCSAVTVNSSGAATCQASPTTLLVGTNIPISVTYTGDSNYTVASAGTMSQTISKADTTTSMSSLVNPSTVNQSVTFTATVAPSPVPLLAGEVPFAGTGTVAFYLDGSSTPMTGCSAQAVTYNAGTGQATASCASASLNASGSPHSIAATYGGDANYNGSDNTAAPLSQTVNKATTTTALTSFPVSPTAVNQSVTFTAQVSPTSGIAFVPFSGTVTFKDNGNSIADCPAATISSAGVATCIATSLSATTHNFVATYAGDSNYNTSVSNIAAQVVNALTPTLSVTAVPAGPSSVNTAVTFTAQLVGVALTPVIPSGTISFKINGKSNADCPDKQVDASGKATCTTNSLTAGGNTVSATYAGDTNFTVATAGTATQTVAALAATLGVIASPSSSTSVNTAVTFTAQLAGAVFTPVVPSGNAAFTANGATIFGCAAVPVNATGKATCTTSSLAAGSAPITATYIGDSNFTVASAGTATQTVTALATTIGVSASPSSSTSVNTAVTFTAQLAGGPFALAPSGTVLFTANGSAINGCPAVPVNASGAATCTTSSLIAGSDPITATYTGDSNYTVATAGTITQTVSALPATLGVTASPSGATTVNDAVTFKAQLAGVTMSPVVPAGAVLFTANGSTITGCSAVTVNASGTATCSTSALIAGSDTITATYSGDGNFTVASPGTMTQTVAKASTTTALNSSSITSTVDQLVTLTATVSLSGGTLHVPFGGSVTFKDGGGSVAGCTSPIVVNTATGIAACTTSALTAGSHSITVTYGSDSNYTGVVSNTVTQTMSQAVTTTTLSTPVTPSTVDQPVTFTATVAPISGTTTVPFTGTVAFSANGAVISGCSATVLTISAGAATATCTTTTLAAGTLSIVATFAGDSNYGGSTSSTATQTVNKASTTTTLTSANSSSPLNQPVILTATVAVSGTAYVPYSGLVTFMDGANPITGCTTATAVNPGTGVATCTATALNSGAHAILAIFAGDSNYANSTSNTMTQTISALAATIGVSASPSSSTSVNQQVTFSAQLGGVLFTPVVPAGKVSFTNNGNAISGCAAVNVDATGKATCTTSSLAGGASTIMVTYAGDTNFAVANAGTMIQNVVPLAATLGLTASPSSSTSVNQQVTFTAQLAGSALAPVVPTGIVAFTANGAAISGCSAKPVNSAGAATCTTSALIAGSDPITATYSGDTNYSVAAPAAITQTVAALNPTMGLTASPSSSTSFNDTVTFTVQLAGTSFSPVAPAGTVSFTANGSAISGCAAVSVNSTGAAACTTSSLAKGFLTIAAAYSGDSNYTVAAAGTTTQTVTATTTTAAANASLNYSPNAQTVSLSAAVTSAAGTVNAGTVTFTVLNGGTVIGTPATSGTVTGGAATVAYTLPAGLTAGSYGIQAVYNASNYFVTSTDTAHMVSVLKVTPTITWTTPAAIIYGSSLSSTQLNATASVPGSFVYTPAAGSTPAVGSNTLSVTFTPADTANYNTATATVTLTVNNPVPVLSGISPGFTSAGGMVFTLTVTGQSFMPNSTVSWGSTALATTYASATRLTAQVTAASFASAGVTTITVQTPTPGGGSSNALQFEVDTAGSTSTSPTFSSLTATVTAGSTATYPVTLPSTVSGVFVTCLNLPTGATCSYSSTTNTLTITTTSATPKGTYQITAIFTETLAGAATAGILLPFFLLPLLFMRKKLAKRTVWVTACLALVLTAAAAFSIGCGGSTQTHQVTSSGTISLIVQ